jgi:hypothetical protein
VATPSGKAANGKEEEIDDILDTTITRNIAEEVGRELF